jgi:hypothetical protein
VPARTPTREHQRALAAHRQRLVRLAEGRGVSRLKRLYDRAQDELEVKLRRVPAGRKDEFTAHQHRVMLAQARQGQMVIARAMAGESVELSREAQVESLRGLGGWIGRMEKEYVGAAPTLPIDEAARFWGVIDKRRTSLIRAHEASMASYGARVTKSIEEGLGLSLATGETTEQAVDRVRAAANNEWWQAERIVRTEQAWAFNATAADGIAEIAEDVEDLYMRWTEHVTDEGEPMDDRVGEDSVVMHGQVARPGGLFTMPRDERVSESMWGERWSFPPNRPNDRATLLAWRPSWGGLAWELRRGRRVDLGD